MSPYEFEEAVADVWSAKGYNTTVKSQTNDKAVDVVATSGTHKILIQAKRYATGNKIGGPDVRKYATLYQQDPDADEVVIVTTSSFTSQAKEIAAEQGVRIINGSQFSKLVDKHSILRSHKTVNKRRGSLSANNGGISNMSPSEKFWAGQLLVGLLGFLILLILIPIIETIVGDPTLLYVSSSENGFTQTGGILIFQSFVFAELVYFYLWWGSGNLEALQKADILAGILGMNFFLSIATVTASDLILNNVSSSQSTNIMSASDEMSIIGLLVFGISFIVWSAISFIGVEMAGLDWDMNPF
jgi:hypothetical protein